MGQLNNKAMKRLFIEVDPKKELPNKDDLYLTSHGWLNYDSSNKGFYYIPEENVSRWVPEVTYWLKETTLEELITEKKANKLFDEWWWKDFKVDEKTGKIVWEAACKAIIQLLKEKP